MRTIIYGIGWVVVIGFSLFVLVILGYFVSE